jgi:hypothetical protein
MGGNDRKWEKIGEDERIGMDGETRIKNLRDLISQMQTHSTPLVSQ